MDAECLLPRGVPVRNCDRRPLQEAKRQLLKPLQLVQPPRPLREQLEKNTVEPVRLALRVQEPVPVHAHFPHQNLVVSVQRQPPKLQPLQRRRLPLPRPPLKKVGAFAGVAPPKRRRPPRVLVLLKRQSIQLQLQKLPPKKPWPHCL